MQLAIGWTSRSTASSTDMLTVTSTCTFVVALTSDMFPDGLPQIICQNTRLARGAATSMTALPF